jgi:hypothetical protein
MKKKKEYFNKLMSNPTLPKYIKLIFKKLVSNKKHIKKYSLLEDVHYTKEDMWLKN